MSNLIDDISKLTTIPDKVLLKLVDKSYFCISSAIEEALLEHKDIVEIDLGIGTLYLEVKSESVRYKFLPNKELDKTVKDTVINRKNSLQDVLEMTLVDRITNTYKELI